MTLHRSVSTPVLMLGIFLYTRWRSYKGLKEGVYHVSAHHDGWEDIRENVLNYDEEGGGEEDQVCMHTHILSYHSWSCYIIHRNMYCELYTVCHDFCVF